MLFCKTASIFHFPRVGGIDSLTNKTYKKKSQKQIEKQKYMIDQERDALNEMERDACKTKRKLSRGFTN